MPILVLGQCGLDKNIFPPIKHFNGRMTGIGESKPFFSLC